MFLLKEITFHVKPVPTMCLMRERHFPLCLDRWFEGAEGRVCVSGGGGGGGGTGKATS